MAKAASVEAILALIIVCSCDGWKPREDDSVLRGGSPGTGERPQRTHALRVWRSDQEWWRYSAATCLANSLDACSIACARCSGGLAPLTASRLPKMKKGTPWMPA